MTAALEGVSGQQHAQPHFTPGKELVPILQETGWSQGRSGRAENLVPTGIRSPTVQPVVSRYIDWATRPTELYQCNIQSTRILTSFIPLKF